MSRKLGMLAVIGLALMCILSPIGLASAQPPPAQSTLPFVGLARPHAVAVNAQHVFVVDTGNNRVLKLPVVGGRQEQLPFRGLNSPQSVAVSAAGDVFVADTFNNRVLKLGAGSRDPTVLPTTYVDYVDKSHLYTLSSPRGLTVNEAGDVFVADDWTVVRLPAAAAQGIGQPSHRQYDSHPSQPIGVAVNRAGDIFLAGGRFGIRGALVPAVKLSAGANSWADLPFSGFLNPQGLAVNDSGDVLVTDAEADHVLRLPWWNPTSQIIVPFTGLIEPSGVALNNAGHVFVADTGNNRVVKLTSPCVGFLCEFHSLLTPSPPELPEPPKFILCDLLPQFCSPCGPFGICLPLEDG